MNMGWDFAEVQESHRRAAGKYLEFLAVPAMSAGLYVLEAGAADRQEIHSEDEIYVVMGGRSQFVLEGEVRSVTAGTLLYVPAGADHRFFDIEERLEVLVFFAPREGSQAAEE